MGSAPWISCGGVCFPEASPFGSQHSFRGAQCFSLLFKKGLLVEEVVPLSSQLSVCALKVSELTCYSPEAWPWQPAPVP